ncbi:MAG: NADPH-dependent oxidoreductase [Alphaproteobacteria bacterium]|nr:NADPH-dependent oxidoreductase [Alphaproteobacteria bacterium]
MEPERFPPGERNPVLETLLAHRSTRRYRDAPLPAAALDLILTAAQRAPTSSNLQSYSIVVVDDRELLERMCRLCGSQRFVAECSALLVFCSDITRHIHVCESRGYVYRGDHVNTLLVAHGDANLACQNASIAAQSMGLGTCMLGNVRNDPQGVSDLLGLPRYVYASVGLAVGYPAEDLGVRPRLPRRVVVSRNRYSDDHLAEDLAAYDEAMRRTGIYDGRREPLNDVAPGTPDPVPDAAYGWAEHTARRLGGENQLQRRGLGAFLDAKGFSRR